MYLKLQSLSMMPYQVTSTKSLNKREWVWRQWCRVLCFLTWIQNPELPAFELHQPHSNEALVVPHTSHLRNVPTDLHLMNIWSSCKFEKKKSPVSELFNCFCQIPKLFFLQLKKKNVLGGKQGSKEANINSSPNSSVSSHADFLYDISSLLGW